MTIVLAMIPIAAFAGNKGRPGKVPEQRITALVKDFKGYDGFDVIRIGKLGTSLLKSVGRIYAANEGDDETALALEAMKGLKSIMIVDYEDAAPKVKDRFSAKVSALLEDCELLMSFTEDDETMYIYGTVEEDSTVVKDMVMFSPGDVLICMLGSISIEKAMKVADM